MIHVNEAHPLWNGGKAPDHYDGRFRAANPESFTPWIARVKSHDFGAVTWTPIFFPGNLKVWCLSLNNEFLRIVTYVHAHVRRAPRMRAHYNCPRIHGHARCSLAPMAVARPCHGHMPPVHCHAESLRVRDLRQSRIPGLFLPIPCLMWCIAEKVTFYESQDFLYQFQDVGTKTSNLGLSRETQDGWHLWRLCLICTIFTQQMYADLVPVNSTRYLQVDMKGSNSKCNKRPHTRRFWNKNPSLPCLHVVAKSLA